MADRRTRAGFTLVELLVVISLVSILATLVVVYVVPAFQDNKNVLRGADRVAQTLMIARQRALRDQAPRGVRFTVVSGQARDLRYVEQPDPYRTGTVQITDNGDTTGTATFAGSNLFGSAASGDLENYAVQPGDWLQVNGTNNFEITAVTSATTASLRRGATVASTSFKIIRQARPIAGEEPVRLPQNVAVNIGFINAYAAGNNVPMRSNTGAAIYEILFDPASGVINRGSGTPVVLWVDDETVEDPANSSRALILGIYPRTGMIATHPKGPAGAYPSLLQYALDGKSSGM